MIDKSTVDAELEKINKVIAEGEYKDSWQSLSNHAVPEWYKNAKFGIFIHWGVYSVPAFSNEWYSRDMYDKNTPSYRHHIKTYGNQKDFGYKDFIPMFKAENFDAEVWADLFKKSGAKYVMPVAEHHDGFAMYSTKFNRYNCVDMGPCQDVLAKIKTECENNGIVFCASNHRAEHYFFMNMGNKIESDINNADCKDFYEPAYYCKELDSFRMHRTTADCRSVGASEEYLKDWLVRLCEFVDNYQPSVVYFDWWIHNLSFKPYLKKFAAYYYNRANEWGKQVTINYKHNAFAPGSAVFDVERGALTDISPVPWQTCTSIAKNSWGYTKNNSFKSVNHIVCDLIDIVSKNGIMLLNIGPKPDGTITEQETKVLLGVGEWLNKNGEGIYSTVPWKRFGEGKVNAKSGFFQDGKEKPYTHKDFRFTYKDGCIYAFWMKCNGKNAKIKSLCTTGTDFDIKSITLIGSDKKIRFNRTSKYLEIFTDCLVSDLPLCFKIEID